MFSFKLSYYLSFYEVNICEEQYFIMLFMEDENKMLEIIEFEREKRRFYSLKHPITMIDDIYIDEVLIFDKFFSEIRVLSISLDTKIKN